MKKVQTYIIIQNFRHLKSMRPLVNDSEYDELVELSAEFETSIAPRLQRYLWLKWIWSDNYVSDWWEEYVYLMNYSNLQILKTKQLL